MRCRELGNYLTKCLDIPAVADDAEFRNFLGFPANFMNLKARAYSVMPGTIDHAEGEGDDGADSGSGDEDEPPAALVPPPGSDAASSSSSPATKPRAGTGSNKPTAKTTASSTTSSSSAIVKNAPPPPQDDDGIAMFDYAGTEPGELAFNAGEIVHMIESEAPKDWAAGYTDRSTADKPGYFPRSFVRPFTSEDYVYNSSTAKWSLREDVAQFTYDPASASYHYNSPPRASATSLYK